jgi:hypothetical protein
MSVEDQRLRDAFQAGVAVAGDGTRCPTSERLWASAREELRGEENESIVLHLAECAACATAWRLARELAAPGTAESGEARDGVRRWRPLRYWVPLAAAAVLVVGVGVRLVMRPTSRVDEPVYRSESGPEIRSTVPASLPREAFLLRWEGGPEGTTYDVLVTSERLEPLDRASRLAEPQHLVEEARLATLAAGDRVLWRVIAHLPGGREAASPTFATAVR